jgi:protein SCO1/2
VIVAALIVALASAPSLGTAIGPPIGLDEHVGARVPAQLAFTDSTGHRVVLADLRDDRPIVLVLAYARCRMLCSVVLHGLTAAVRASHHVPGRDVLPVVVSLDPDETVDEAARRQAQLLGQAGLGADRAAWPYLVGDDASIHVLADALGFHYAWDPRTEQYAHPAVVFVLTPDERIAEYVRGVTFDDLDDAIDRAARGELTPSTARDLLRCFHDDPARRRYETKLQTVFRIGAAAIFAAVVALVLGLFAWERRRRRCA